MKKKQRKHNWNGTVVFWVMLSVVLLSVGAASTNAENRIGTAKYRLRQAITYSCTDLPIDTVLIDLAEQAGIDIVKSPKVTGNVTVKVTNVPLEEALTNILAAHDFTYIATESMIRVVPIPEIVAAREQLVTRIYKITYADANDVAGALSGFVSAQGEVAFNRGTKHIIVTDTEKKIKAIDKFVEQIDHITGQVLVEVRVYDITSNEGFELENDWFVGRNEPLTYDTVFPPSEVTTTEVGRTDFYEERTDEIEGEDRDRDSDYTDTRDEHSWTEPAIETQTTYTNPEPMRTNYRRKPFVGGSFDRVRGGTLRFSVLNDAVAVDYVLSILHKQVEAKLLANPRILVLDNETANFDIMRQIPYRELLQVAREDPISYTEFKHVGVHLKVTPHIATGGMMKLHIAPEFGVLVNREGLSILTGQNALGQDLFQDVLGAPTVDTRRVDTTALIRDGQTIVLGGLRQKETSKDVSKVPLLCDMPLVGGLFRSETEVVKTKELVVFITASIITEPVLTETEQRQLSATQFNVPEVRQTNLERERAARQKLMSEIKEVQAPVAESIEPDVTELQPRYAEDFEIDIEAVEPQTDAVEVTEITIILDKLLEKTSEEP
ncbi:MAG: secretin N-terminal domain-containing protein [Planctomycetota bacterium]